MIKSILGGKSKNLCDVDYLLTLPVDKTFQNNGYWRVLINAEPNTTYTFSRENANQITDLGNTYLAISAYDDILHNNWLSHHAVQSLNNKSATLTTGSEGKLWILFGQNVYNNYWQKNLNPFGYIQLEKGSTATEYVPHELTSYKSIMKVSDVCQLVPISDKADKVVNGITFTNNHDGGWAISGTHSEYTWYNLFANIPLKNGHKYLNAGAGSGTYIEIKWYDKDDVIHWEDNPYTADENSKCDVTLMRASNATGVKIVFPQLFDLTEMFGAGNEPKTVAEFKAKFPNDYYPYSPSCFVTSFDERMPCKTKNLFSSSTEVGTLEGGFGGPTVARNFEENKWYRGFTTNGYYSPGNVPDFDIHPNSLYVYSRGAGYGMSRAIKCEPNTKYFISCSYSHISGSKGNVYVGYFDEGGNFISNSNIEMKYQYVVTTPSNCKWLIINFTTQGVGKVYFSDIQLVKGTTATDYVPYGYV